MDRRKFIKAGTSLATGIAGSRWFPDFLNSLNQQDEQRSYAEYLRKSAVPKEELDIFLKIDQRFRVLALFLLRQLHQIG